MQRYDYFVYESEIPKCYNKDWFTYYFVRCKVIGTLYCLSFDW